MLRSSQATLFTGIVLLAVAYAPLAAETETHAAADPQPPEAPPKLLDLRAPDVTKLWTREQIDRILAKTFDENIEEVEVEGVRGERPTVTPHVWPAIAAPLWAILHPTQAWRIFAPLPPDQVRGAQERPDATAGYLEPAAAVHP